jgi:hypothetical protein
MKRKNAQLAGMLIIAAGCIAAAPANASRIGNGIAYSLTEAITADPQTNQFTLSITGITAVTDTEGGRYGVGSFAFSQPDGFISAAAPTEFTAMLGGLNAGGCDGSGNFFCCYVDTVSTVPALAANSTLSFVFRVTPMAFLDYAPDFKTNRVARRTTISSRCLSRRRMATRLRLRPCRKRRSFRCWAWVWSASGSWHDDARSFESFASSMKTPADAGVFICCVPLLADGRQ